MGKYDTQDVEFDNYRDWQIAINDSRVEQTFVSAWKSGDYFYIRIYLMKG